MNPVKPSYNNAPAATQKQAPANPQGQDPKTPAEDALKSRGEDVLKFKEKFEEEFEKLKKKKLGERKPVKGEKSKKDLTELTDIKDILNFGPASSTQMRDLKDAAKDVKERAPKVKDVEISPMDLFKPRGGEDLSNLRQAISAIDSQSINFGRLADKPTIMPVQDIDAIVMQTVEVLRTKDVDRGINESSFRFIIKDTAVSGTEVTIKRVAGNIQIDFFTPSQASYALLSDRTQELANRLQDRLSQRNISVKVKKSDGTEAVSAASFVQAKRDVQDSPVG